MKPINYALLTLLLALPAAQASVDDEDMRWYVEPYQGVDPFEPINRVMWSINYTLDKHLIRPPLHWYSENVPTVIKDGVLNFAWNFEEPSTAVNHLVSGDVQQSATAVSRFVLNSTVGVLGFFDVAGYAGLDRNLRSFDEVLADWGMDHGAYIMVPVYGPTSIRDELGGTVDKLYFPLSALTFWGKATRWGMEAVGKREKLIPQETLLDEALDPYVLVRDAYLQNHGVVLPASDNQLSNDEIEAYLDE